MRATAIGDHFLILAQLGEPALEFRQRDVDRTRHMSGGIFGFGAYIEQGDAGFTHPAQELFGVDRFEPVGPRATVGDKGRELHVIEFFMLTFVLASVGIVASLPLGILLAIGRRSRLPAIRIICVTFIEAWRANPLITVLFMVANLLPLFFPSDVDLDKVGRALVAITLFQSAYTAEAVRAGLAAIPKGQFEAAHSLGVSTFTSYRLIILPQALKISIPGIVNSFIELFKDTSLVAIIGLFDFLRMAQVVLRSPEWRGFEYEAYVFTALVYWVICYGMSKYSQALEQRLHRGHATDLQAR